MEIGRWGRVKMEWRNWLGKGETVMPFDPFAIDIV
jgi:hypothetical protein